MVSAFSSSLYRTQCCLFYDLCTTFPFYVIETNPTQWWNSSIHSSLKRREGSRLSLCQKEVSTHISLFISLLFIHFVISLVHQYNGLWIIRAGTPLAQSLSVNNEIAGGITTRKTLLEVNVVLEGQLLLQTTNIFEFFTRYPISCTLGTTIHKVRNKIIC